MSSKRVIVLPIAMVVAATLASVLSTAHHGREDATNRLTPAAVSASGKTPRNDPVNPARVDDLDGIGAASDGQGRLTRQISLLRGVTVVDVPSPQARPAITRNDAIADFARAGVYPATQKRYQPYVMLGELTDRDMRSGVSESSQGTQTYVRRLVWMVAFHDIVTEYHPSGPGNAPPATAAADPIHVNLVAFIDADSGEFLFSKEIGLIQPT